MEGMEEWQAEEGTIGSVSGPFQTEILVCHRVNNMVGSLGVWYSDPFDFAMPVLMFQIILIFFVARILFLFLKPLRPSLTIAYIMAGIVIGPSVMGHSHRYLAKVFPPGGITLLMTFSELGFLIHLFTIGVQVDTGILRRARKSELLIGTMCFLSPYVVAYLSYFALRGLVDTDGSLKYSVPYIAVVNSISSFPVITSLLTDLRMLNSDLGRFAAHVSLVCDSWSWLLALLSNASRVAFRHSKSEALWSIFCTFMFIALIVFIIRPVTKWSTQRAQDGDEEEVHFFEIIVIMLGCALLAETLGQHSGFGAYLMGLALPHGPPLGTTLVQKLETVSERLLVPALLAASGVRTHLSSMVGASLWHTQVIIMMGYVGKFSGTLVTAFGCGVPFCDAIPLSLIMCCKGIIEVSVYGMWYDRKIINKQVYSQLVVTMVIVTTLVRPIIAHLHDPSSRYMINGRRTLPQSKEGVKVQILVCLHDENNVPTVMSLLEASNPTPHSPISVFVLHLEELKGRCAAVLVPHHHLGRDASRADGSDHVVNAFANYEQRNHGSAVVQHFTAISPYETMHDDVCALALDKRTHLIIMPFHKTWAIDGSVGHTKHAFRNVNMNVMGKAPCSIGVLIDRGPVATAQCTAAGETAPYRVFVLFLGGADDREALAYSMRMVDHPWVSLTIVRIKSREDENEGESQLDKEAMDDFWAKVGDNRKVVKYIEEVTKDGVGTIQVIHSVETMVDLLIVGKHHDPSSPLVSGLTEWSEFPELGVIGDLLATSDFIFSVLV
ncbi:Na_H_Exchanger domain-containing protein, partial [Psidium guajava]